MKLLLVLSLAVAAAAAAKPIRHDHPIVGTWKIAMTDTCTEVHTYRRDGTSHSVSGEEITDGVFDISDAPDEKGLYQFSDKIVSSNGKPDCFGSTTSPGEVATYQVRFNSPADRMTAIIPLKNGTAFVTMVRVQDR